MSSIRQIRASADNGATRVAAYRSRLVGGAEVDAMTGQAGVPPVLFQKRASAHQGSPDCAEIVLDRARQHSEMDDRAPVVSGLQACYFAHRSSILAACHKDSASLDQARITSLIKEGPEVPAAVVVVEI